MIETMRKLFAPLTIALALTGCAATVGQTPPAPPHMAVQDQRAPVTILISIDGFRYDYLSRGITPTLSGLAATGITAPMSPSFPSVTFPNHWALVTGEYPDHNGITSNSFIDPRRPDEKFTMATTDPFYWGEAEPLWVTAEKAGVRTAAMFWPGSAVGWGGTVVPRSHGKVEGGIRPEDWQAFDQQVSGTQRVNSVLDWLRRPADIRPKFLTLYFNTVDSAGHANAQNSPQLNAAIADIDGHIANLMDGLKALHQPANLVIVADHGMAEISSDRIITLDKIVDPSLYTLVDKGPFASFNPVPGHEAELAAALLVPHPHMQCWRKQDIPARLHYGTNPRIPAIFCLAETGWLILDRPPSAPFVGGAHGYDNMAPEMQALFIANGPAFRHGVKLPPFINVDINPLIRKLIGLPQDPKLDGTITPLLPALESSVPSPQTH